MARGASLARRSSKEGVGEWKGLLKEQRSGVSPHACSAGSVELLDNDW